MQGNDAQIPKLILHICVAGELPKDQANRDIVLSKFDKVIHDTVKHSSRYSNNQYGFLDNPPEIQFIMAPHLIDKELLGSLRLKYKNYKFLSVSESLTESSDSILEDDMTVLGDETSKVDKGLVLSWICDQTDFAIIIENAGDEQYQEFVRYCKYEAVPTVTIFSLANKHMLWTEKSYYDSYDNDKLEQYLDTLFGAGIGNQEQEENQRLLKRIPLWSNLYKRYLKKNKEQLGKTTAVLDTIVTKDANISSISEAAEQTRSKLYDLYDEYDQKAIEYSDKYHASIYLRAVIPLVVTIVLAVGFYAEPLLGFWNIQISGKLKLWAIIAGIGFFLHALLNAYIYILSENKVIKSWHQNFIDYRFIAETLRLAIHFIPFGIPVNYQKHLNKYGSKYKNNQKSVRRLRCILKEIGMPKMSLNKATISKCIDNLEELINNQLQYHKKSANQYAKIYDKLKRYGKIIFYIGFIFVLLRGVLQLYISFNDIPNEGFVKAFANMLALIFPVWAAYFTTKLTLCNFEGLYTNHRNMIDELLTIKQMINDEQQKDNLTYADLYYLSKDVTSVILGDVCEWYSQINVRKVTRL